MPSFRRRGASIDVASLGGGKARALVSGQALPPPIQADLFARPNKHPDAALINQLNRAGNVAGICRTKEVFRAIARLESGNSIVGLVPSSFGAGDRARFRFAFRTGKYAHALGIIVGMVPQDSGMNQNSYCRLDISNGAGAIVGTTTFVYGANPIGSTYAIRGWQYYKQIMGFIDGLDVDTEYYGVFTDVNFGRLHSACVFELSSFTENFNGYLPQNITNHSAILDVHRENLVTLQNNLLQKSAATLFSWTVEDGTVPVSRAGTAVNVLDGSSTSNTASSPGWKMDLTNKDRRAELGVPVVMKVCAKNTTGAGVVSLVDSSGTTVLSISAGWTSSITWQSVSGYIPAGVDKFDLHVASSSGTVSLYAVSLYQYG